MTQQISDLAQMAAAELLVKVHGLDILSVTIGTVGGGLFIMAAIIADSLNRIADVLEKKL